MVVDIEKAVTDIYSSRHSETIVTSIKNLLGKFTDYKGKTVNMRDALQSAKEIAIDKVKQIRKSIDSLMDKLEASAVSEIAEIHSIRTKCLDEQSHVCEASMAVLQKRLSNLDSVKSTGNDREMFIGTNKATKDVKEYCLVLHDLYENRINTDIRFEASKDVTNLHKTVQTLGTTFTVETTNSCQTSESSFIYMGELKVQTETDTKEPFELTYEVLPGERRLIVDTKNKKT